MPSEAESKFANDTNLILQSNEQNMNTIQNPQENTPQDNATATNNNGMSSGQQMNGQELLLQILASGGNLAGLVQGATAQNSQGINQANAQSLLLLQRIIQNTPEIHVLHQQEQLALYQIQQHIRNALTQNMGQEIVSQLVLEYKKTQDQHQQNIQAAIQRKLTMIL